MRPNYFFQSPFLHDAPLPLRRAVGICFTTILAIVILRPVAANAGDYINVCRSADGQYEVNDGELSRTGETGKQIPFEMLGEKILESRSGYCTSRKAPGQKFRFESKNSVMTIRFIDHGQTMTTTVVCEMAGDGLPAMYDCDEQVVTSQTGGSSGSKSAGAKRWDHNGSTMSLRADGASRTFIYEKPRSGVRKAGARQGTVLFEGRRQGDTYVGTAYIFSRRCGPQPYAASGPVAPNERRVTLYGDAPVVDKTCQIRSRKRDRLEFTLIGE